MERRAFNHKSSKDKGPELTSEQTEFEEEAKGIADANAKWKGGSLFHLNHSLIASATTLKLSLSHSNEGKGRTLLLACGIILLLRLLICQSVVSKKSTIMDPAEGIQFDMVEWKPGKDIDKHKSRDREKSSLRYFMTIEEPSREILERAAQLDRKLLKLQGEGRVKTCCYVYHSW